MSMSNEKIVREWMGGLPAVFSFHAVEQRVPKLLGETLTVLDASLHDPIARKAAKDLVKKSFYGWVTSLNEEARLLDPDGHGRVGGNISLEENQA
jgi:hypothetical protein